MTTRGMGYAGMPLYTPLSSDFGAARQSIMQAAQFWDDLQRRRRMEAALRGPLAQQMISGITGVSPVTAQGPDAAGGAYDYVVKGRMIGGFALVAYPATYGVSGIMTFIVNQDGVVHQKDLGPKTSEVANAMKTYNPDRTWATADAGSGKR